MIQKKRKMTEGGSFRWVAAIVIMLAVLLADQIIKIYVKTHFCLHETLQITGWFQLVFTENEGMAFGMSFIGTMFLTIFRLIAISVFFWLLKKVINKQLPFGIIVCLSLIIAGAAGNIIDNCFYGLVFSESSPYFEPATIVPFGEGYGKFLEGRVVDMFYFPLFTWPDAVPLLGGKVFFNAIFNFADAAISCGAVVLLLFYYKYLTGAKINSEKNSEEPISE